MICRVMCLALMLVAGLCFAGADPAKKTNPSEAKIPVIKAADALKHADQNCTVEMTVQASRHLLDRNICFLNSLCKRASIVLDPRPTSRGATSQARALSIAT